MRTPINCTVPRGFLSKAIPRMANIIITVSATSQDVHTQQVANELQAAGVWNGSQHSPVAAGCSLLRISEVHPGSAVTPITLDRFLPVLLEIAMAKT